MLVKKYPNRRLYDTEDSRYITLDELAEKVRRGQDVLVQDAETGHDLTQATLTQIILESRGGAKLLPTPMLLHLVRLNDDALGEFFGRWLSWSLELYLAARSQTAQVAPFPALSPFGPYASHPLGRMFMGPWSDGYVPSGARSEAVAPPPPPAPTPPADDITALRRELDDLRRTVNGPRKAPPAKKKARTRAR